jgi:hypothetical protein
VIEHIGLDRAQYEVADGGFTAHHSLTFLCGEGPELDFDRAVTIRADYAVEYASPLPMTDAYFETFRALNLPLNTWPYFREFVHSTLARAGWPPTTLPAFRVGAGKRGAALLRDAAGEKAAPVVAEPDPATPKRRLARRARGRTSDG